MKILFSGDVFGSVGRQAVAYRVPHYREKHKVGLVIANGENITNGLGMKAKHVKELFDSGVDVITGGNHSLKQRDVFPLLEKEKTILRPANLPKKSPGRGYVLWETYPDIKIAIVNLMGRVFMDGASSPFDAIDFILDEVAHQAKIIIVDMHAEATSEKRAMGWYLDGKVSAVLGTHTHVPTADEEILPKGTAYITDVGMTGPYDSIIGVKKEIALNKFTQFLGARFEPAEGDVRFSAVLLDVEENTGKTTHIKRIHEKVEVS